MFGLVLERVFSPLLNSRLIERVSFITHYSPSVSDSVWPKDMSLPLLRLHDTQLNKIPQSILSIMFHMLIDID